jgi:type II secretory pathway pseudopilin PulG
MKYKPKRSSPGGGKGITLVEVVVSVALLAILSLMLVTFMITSLMAVKTTRGRTNNAMSAASQIESQRAAGTADGGASSDLTITFGTSSYDVTGKYVSGSGSGVTYYEFVPD